MLNLPAAFLLLGEILEYLFIEYLPPPSLPRRTDHVFLIETDTFVRPYGLPTPMPVCELSVYGTAAEPYTVADDENTMKVQPTFSSISTRHL